MSHTLSGSGVIHQFDTDVNYYDEDDLITFQIDSKQINFYYSHLSRYSKLIRQKYLSSDVETSFVHDLCKFKEQQNVKTENIVFFFRLLQNDFNIDRNVTYNEYRDLFKITEFLQVKKFLINLNRYFESQNDVTDFQIQIILLEIKNINDNENSQFQLSQAMEDLLSAKIAECLQNDNFAKIPISIIYRIIEKSDKNQISSDILYDFIKKDVKSFFVLFSYLYVEHLSDEKFEDLYESFCKPNGPCKMYMKYLPCNLSYIMNLKNDKKNIQGQINQLKENLDQTKKLLDDTENEKNQLKQENKDLNDVISQQRDELKGLKQKNEENENKIDEIEKNLAKKEEEHEKYVKEESIRLYDKGDYNKVEIKVNKMNDDQKNYTIEITKKSLEMHDDHFECAKYISDQLKNKYGGVWCAILLVRNYGNSYAIYYDNCYISFTMGEFFIKIFKQN